MGNTRERNSTGPATMPPWHNIRSRKGISLVLLQYIRKVSISRLTFAATGARLRWEKELRRFTRVRVGRVVRPHGTTAYAKTPATNPTRQDTRKKNNAFSARWRKARPSVESSSGFSMTLSGFPRSPQTLTPGFALNGTRIKLHARINQATAPTAQAKTKSAIRTLATMCKMRSNVLVSGGPLRIENVAHRFRPVRST